MKRELLPLLVLFLGAVPSYAQDDPPPKPAPPHVTGWLRLPDADPAVIQPIIQPVNVLKSNELYVFDADKKVIVIASPAGLVSVTEDVGPIKIKAVFAGNAKSSTRTFKGQQVFTLEAVASGTVELIITPVDLKKETDIIRRTIRVEAGEGPIPPPGPGPIPPGPGPGPFPPPLPPAPIAGDGLRVLMTFPEKASLTQAQHSAIYGQDVRDYLNRKTPLGPDGKTHEWRIYKEGENLAGEAATWRDAYARKRDSSPWIVVSNGKTGEEVPVTSIDQVMKLLKKYGGD